MRLYSRLAQKDGLTDAEAHSDNKPEIVCVGDAIDDL